MFINIRLFFHSPFWISEVSSLIGTSGFPSFLHAYINLTYSTQTWNGTDELPVSWQSC